MNYIVLLGCFLLFPFGGALLEVLGWGYLSPDASGILKIHPSTYLFAGCAAYGLLSIRRECWRVLRNFRYVFFIIAALAVSLRAVLISLSGFTSGELSAALVTFLTPAIMLICLPTLTGRQIANFGIFVRGFFIFNSLMGIAERIVGHRFIPSSLDAAIGSGRACALLAHPLNAALMTGMMIVHLATARNKDLPFITRVPELLIHTAAMFAFGGRASLVATPAVIAFGSLSARRREGEAEITLVARLAPIAVLLASASFIFLPIPFIEATLDRFTQDTASTATRSTALDIVTSLDWRSLVWGVSSVGRALLLQIFQIRAIELAWLALTITYGLVIAVPLAAAMVNLFFGIARKLDRSASNMALFFFVATFGSLSIGSKSLLVAQSLLAMLSLCRRSVAAPASAPSRQPRYYRPPRELAI